MASGVSLSGSMVMRMGVKFGRDFILSVENTKSSTYLRKWGNETSKVSYIRIPCGQKIKINYLFHPQLQSFSLTHRGRCQDSEWTQNKWGPTGQGSPRSWWACCCDRWVRTGRPAPVDQSTWSALFQSLQCDWQQLPIRDPWFNNFYTRFNIKSDIIY